MIVVQYNEWSRNIEIHSPSKEIIFEDGKLVNDKGKTLADWIDGMRVSVESWMGPEVELEMRNEK